MFRFSICMYGYLSISHLSFPHSFQQAFTGISYVSDLLLGAEDTEVMVET